MKPQQPSLFCSNLLRQKGHRSGTVNENIFIYKFGVQHCKLRRVYLNQFIYRKDNS